nr:MAG TPA_asm: hypothetical protein [Caudoviricetes sp.]
MRDEGFGFQHPPRPHPVEFNGRARAAKRGLTLRRLSA